MNKRLFWIICLRLAITYIAIVAIGWGMLYGTHCIPFEMIRTNVDKSAQIIHQEGNYDLLGDKFHLPLNKYNVYSLDGFTDALMLMESCNTGQENVLENVLYNGIVSDGNKSPHEYVQNYTNMDGKKGTYGRYWHGYLSTLIPALVFMDLHQIRILNFFLFSLLLITIAYLSYKKLGKGTTNIFLFVIAISFFYPIVPYSLQYSTVFYISFVAILLLLTIDSLWQKRTHAMILFFIIGGITSYADLLTAPLLSLGTPLIFYALLKEKKNGWEGDIVYKDIFILSGMWLLGYGLIWSTKWMLVYLITGFDMINNAIEQSKTRLGHNEVNIIRMLGKIVFRTPDIIRYTLFISFGYWLWGGKSKDVVIKNLWLLLIAILPVIWMCILRNHSLLHYRFVWRCLIFGVFAILLFIYRTTDSRCVGYLKSIFLMKK